MEKRKHLIIFSTLLTLLPMVAGLLLWDRLPERIPIHWNIHGQVNGWGGKGFVVVGFPLLMAAIHLLGIFFTKKDPKHKVQSEKMLKILLWIVPVMSLIMGILFYGWTLGMQLEVTSFVPVLLGILFVVIGNYLPKCRRSHTIGIKVIWALRSEENWNATHRFGGKAWVIAGLLLILSALFGEIFLLQIIAMILLLSPVAYSYVYYLKNEKA